jgi:hypothetical protein
VKSSALTETAYVRHYEITFEETMSSQNSSVDPEFICWRQRTPSCSLETLRLHYFALFQIDDFSIQIRKISAKFAAQLRNPDLKDLSIFSKRKKTAGMLRRFNRPLAY